MPAIPPPASSDTRVYLFGNFRLECRSKNLTIVNSQKARDLLAYLLLHRKQPHLRRVLVELFWPHLDEDRGRRSLSTVLWRINRVLPDLIVRRSDTLQIPPDAPVWVDVAAFEALLSPDLSVRFEPDDLRRAVALYSGDLLEESGAGWALVLREKFYEMYCQALARLVYVEKRAGRYAEALDVALRLTHANPLDEAHHQEVMRLYIALRRPLDAVRQFELCRTVLRDELGLSPAPRTWELVNSAVDIAERVGLDVPLSLAPAEMQRGDSVLESARATALPLIGRDDERRRLLRYLEETVQGTNRGGNLILVEGEAGVGKTRLVQEFAKDAEWREVEVLWSGAARRDTAQPYTLIVDLLNNLTAVRIQQLSQIISPVWIRAIVPLLPALAEWIPDLTHVPPLEPQQEQDRLREALVQLFAAWAEITPLLIVFEDLHEIDYDSLAFVRLLQRLKKSHILFVGTFRGAEARAQPPVWRTLQMLDRELVCERVHLGHLDLEATATLVRFFLGLSSPAELFESRIYWETRGNPLYIQHMLRTLYEEGMLYRDAGGKWATPFDDATIDYNELRLPSVLEHSLVRRMRMLAPPTRRLLDAAAVLGIEFNLERLLALTEAAPLTLAERLQKLAQLAFLEETAAGFRFNHERVRNVVYAEIEPERRIALHRRAAELLEALSAPPEIIAHHYREGQVWDAAFRFTFEAARWAQEIYANEAALVWYRQALELADRRTGDPSQFQRERVALLKSLGDVLVLLGHYAEAGARFEEARDVAARASSPDACLLAELCGRIADVCERQSNYPLALAWVNRGLDHLDGSGISEERARLCHLSGWIRFCRGEWDAARTWLERAREIAQQTGTYQVEGNSFRTLGVIFARQGQADRARTCYERAIRLYQKANDVRGESIALNNVAALAYDYSEYEDARRYFTRALDLVQRLGDRRIEGAVLGNLGMIPHDLGHYEAARDYYERALVIHRDLGEPLGEAFSLMRIGNLQGLQGDYAGAVATLELAREIYEAIGDRRGEGYVVTELGLWKRHTGDLHAALAESRRGLACAEDYADPQQAGFAGTNLGHALVALGRFEEALAAYREATRVLRTNDLVNLAAESLAGAARALAALDRRTEALEAVEEILALGNPESAGVFDPEVLKGTTEPTCVYLTCYRLLADHGDPRAGAILEIAHAQIREEGARISDPALRHSFLEGVPCNRKIREAYARARCALRPGQRRVRLAHVDAPPYGRPLNDDEYVSVVWTLDAPGDAKVRGKKLRRRHRLLRLLQEARARDAIPTTTELAEALGVSRQTIYSDVKALRKAGHTVETRGSRT